MTIEDDYLKMRKLQKAARAEMWHILSHHPEIEECWKQPYGSCFDLLQRLLDWEPDD